MSNRKTAIIADEYTGACDSGIHFSRVGKQIDLILPRNHLPEELSGRDVIALTTESRFQKPAEAARTVAEVIKQCQDAGFSNFFKKVDSMMRGNPGSEIESALHETGHFASLICPSIPKFGRTCVDGLLYLNGASLHTSDIGNDPFNPITTSSVVELLRQQTSLPIGRITIKNIEAGGVILSGCIKTLIDEGYQLLVADAATDKHLLVLANQVVLADLLPVGASGLAEAVAKTLVCSAKKRKQPPEPLGPILAIVGSLAGVSRLQAEVGCRSGWFHPFEINGEYNLAELERECSRFLDTINYNDHPNILLCLPSKILPQSSSKEEAERIAHLLGSAAALLCRKYDCKTVYSTGGSTSMAVARALGIESVTLVDEFIPGVVLGACNAPHTTVKWFISKAGGFGDEHLLKEMANRIAPEIKGV